MAKGLEKGARNAKIEAARNLLAMHILSVEQIAQAQGLSVEEVQRLASEKGNCRAYERTEVTLNNQREKTPTLATECGGAGVCGSKRNACSRYFI